MTIDFNVLKNLVDVNSWTQNKEGVDRNGLMMMDLFETLGLSAQRFTRSTVGDHWLFSSEYDAGKSRVLLLGHLDTVFSPNTFEGFSEDSEWVYGPGVCDMKGGNFVAWSALCNVNHECKGIKNIDVLLVSDEETGSDDSKTLTTELAKNYDLCLDFEAAGKNHEVVIGRKGVATFTMKLTGKAAHAGNHYQDGINANVAAAKLLLALTDLTDLSLGTTVNVGQIKGGIGANTISPNSELKVEVRFTQKSERDRVFAEINAFSEFPWVPNIEIELSGGLQRDVMMPTPEQAELLAHFERVLGYPLLTEMRGGVSDANTVAAVGVPTLDGFGPFGDGDHTVKERANKASFQKRINEVTKILLSYQ